MKITNIEDINRIEKELLEKVNKLNVNYYLGDAEHKLAVEHIDQRWLAIAITDIEKGFMALRRAIESKE
jgi:hypothetical protein